MPEDRRDNLPHILVRDTATSDNYTSPRSGGGGSEVNTPERNRAIHANQLISEIERAREQEAEIIEEQKAFGLDSGNGIYLAFEC